MKLEEHAKLYMPNSTNEAEREVQLEILISLNHWNMNTDESRAEELFGCTRQKKRQIQRYLMKYSFPSLL